MKTSRDQTSKQSKQGMGKKPRPEIRDNLDSRKQEEQDYKGDDTTHNEKNERSNKQHKKE
jgi:hypothetical protein